MCGRLERPVARCSGVSTRELSVDTLLLDELYRDAILATQGPGLGFGGGWDKPSLRPACPQGRARRALQQWPQQNSSSSSAARALRDAGRQPQRACARAPGRECARTGGGAVLRLVGPAMLHQLPRPSPPVSYIYVSYVYIYPEPPSPPPPGPADSLPAGRCLRLGLCPFLGPSPLP